MRSSSLKPALQLAVGLAIPAACLFLSAGSLDWWNAWVLLGLNLMAGAAAMVVMMRNPELAAERRNVKAGKSWDKPIVAFVVLIGPVATWITAGLDTRFRWSESMGAGALLSGVLVAVPAAALIAWAMHSNRFFSSIVRIQKDRGHVVVSQGPYGFVRHPAYTGMTAYTLVTPLILNSRWAFVPAVLTACVNVLRTALEDRTLHNELDGYAGYAQRVKCRLLPPVW